LKEDFILEMLGDLSKDEPDFQPFFKTYAAYASFGYSFGERLDLGAALGACPLLVAKARKSGDLPALAVLAADAPAPTAEALLKKLQLTEAPFARCVTCHEGRQAIAIGRKIPFSQPALLREKLKAQASGSERTLMEEILKRVQSHGPGQMPPSGPEMSETEVNALQRYLQEVRLVTATR
jgi:mono/diheme cytochrome c family protein